MSIQSETIQTSFGFVITCSTGTSIPVNVYNGSLKIVGIACGGAATTDIITINDGNGILLFKNTAVINQMASLPLGGPIRVQGIQVGFAGATTGFCTIYTTDA